MKPISVVCEEFAIVNRNEAYSEAETGSCYVFDAVDARIAFLRKAYQIGCCESYADARFRIERVPLPTTLFVLEILHFMLKILDILVELNIRSSKGSLLLNDKLYDKRDYPRVMKALIKVMGKTLVSRLAQIYKRRENERRKQADRRSHKHEGKAV